MSNDLCRITDLKTQTPHFQVKKLFAAMSVVICTASFVNLACASSDNVPALRKKDIATEKLNIDLFLTEAVPEGGIDKLGVALSGGGSRSFAATMGQLAALRDAGYLNTDKIGELSAASGGGWAALVYAYRDGKISEDTLFGALADPDQLEWNSSKQDGTNLSYLPKDSMGHIPAKLNLVDAAAKAVLIKARYGYEWSEIWQRLNGIYVLNPFDLNKLKKGRPIHYMGDTESWAKNNPAGLSADKFNLRLDGTIPITLYSSFLADKKHPTFAMPVEINGVYSGTIASRSDDDGSNMVGGGFISTYGYNSINPKYLSHDQAQVDAKGFSLSDASGLTSAFYVPMLIDQLKKMHSMSKPELVAMLQQSGAAQSMDMSDKQVQLAADKFEGFNPSDMIPLMDEWSVASLTTKGEAKSQRSEYMDGLEYTGVMPLLRKGYRKIVSFVNAPLNLKKEGNNIVIEPAVASLYGYTGLISLEAGSQPAYYRIKDLTTDQFNKLSVLEKIVSENQVFPYSAFDDLLAQFAAVNLKPGDEGRGSAVIKQRMKTVSNFKNSVPQDKEVEMVWFYLTGDQNWNNKLNQSVKKKIEENYPSFPNYDTVTEIQLDANKLNVLRQFSGWQVKENMHFIKPVSEGGYDHMWPEHVEFYQSGTTVVNNATTYECLPEMQAQCRNSLVRADALEPGVGSEWQVAWKNVSSQ